MKLDPASQKEAGFLMNQAIYPLKQVIESLTSTTQLIVLTKEHEYLKRIRSQYQADAEPVTKVQVTQRDQ